MQKRFFLLLVLAALVVPASAEQARPLKFDQEGHRQSWPVKPPKADNSCAAYGAGFVKLAGSGTCVKVGGAISVGAGTSLGH